LLWGDGKPPAPFFVAPGVLGQRRTAPLPPNIQPLIPPQPFPHANAPALDQKPLPNRQNLPLDTLRHVWQDAPTMSAGKNQFPLIHAAAITGGAVTSKFRSILINDQAAGH
jgi:hypothetical protein